MVSHLLNFSSYSKYIDRNNSNMEDSDKLYLGVDFSTQQVVFKLLIFICILYLCIRSYSHIFSVKLSTNLPATSSKICQKINK